MAVVALSILISTIVFLYSAYGDHETRYVAMFDEPCMQEKQNLKADLKVCYSPYKIVIDAGSVVMWENIGGQVHTVTSGTLLQPSQLFNSGLIIPDKFYSLQFPSVGIYPYYCMVHPWMNGSVVVGEKLTNEEKDEFMPIVEEEVVIIWEEGMFTNATGTFYANGTAVIPEFGAVAMIVLATAVIGTILITKVKLIQQ